MFWAEIKGKGGRFCGPALSGDIRCPLILRPTSEDLISATTFTLLRYLPPGRWLPEILNTALRTSDFSYKTHKNLKYDLWSNKPAPLPGATPWKEGSTQVDFTLTYENPPTTLYVEAKYGSPLSSRVSNDDGSSGLPSDQLIRNIRVGLWETGHYHPEGSLLPPQPPRQFYCILFAPRRGNPLVRRYRNPQVLRRSLPRPDLLKSLPQPPFIGEISFRDLQGILKGMYQQLSPGEMIVAKDLYQYLEHKRRSVPESHSRTTQGNLPFIPPRTDSPS